jgi:surface protein
MKASLEETDGPANLEDASDHAIFVVEGDRSSRLHEDAILLLTALDSAREEEPSDAIGDTPVPIEKKGQERRHLRAVTPGAVASTTRTERTAAAASSVERPEISDSGAGNRPDTSLKAQFRSRQGELSQELTTEAPSVLPGAISVMPHSAVRDHHRSSDEDDDWPGGRTTDADAPGDPQHSADLVLTAQLAEDMLDASERQRVFDEAVQTISDQVIKAEVLEDDRPRRRRRNRIVLCCLLVSATVLAVSLGATRTKSSNATAPPTVSPTRYVDGDRVFQTTEELYDAVDAYRAAGTASSDVVLRYGPLGAWNVSLITDFSRVFDPIRTDTLSPSTLSDIYTDLEVDEFPRTNFDVARFNEDLSGWDVSNAETMMGMFSRCDSFVGIGLEDWNAAKVRDFSYMFLGANAFNGTVSAWDTSSAERMESMFFGADRFDGNVSSWDVSRVIDMSYMFFSAMSFLGNGVNRWNVSNVVSMESTFQYAYRFNGDVESWDTRNLVAASNLVSKNESVDSVSVRCCSYCVVVLLYL